MVWAVVIIVAVVVIAGLTVLARRQPRYHSDLDRFHHARSITTSWSEHTPREPKP